jgi:steroid 5-alpha reductase family enzyme
VLDLDIQLLTLAAGAGVMVGAWLISLAMRDASVADIAWGMVFVAIAWTALAVGDGYEERSLLIAVLVTIWGVRLSAYIWWRHDGEDKRYVAMRERQGASFPLRSLLTVFLLQSAIAWVVSAPVQAAAADPTPASLGALAVIGAAVTLFGTAFEAISDFQLSRFLAAKSEGRVDGVMDKGLWRYSRHPNYFGNATLWFGIWLIALETGSAWWSVIGPIVMTFFLLRVSGVALTEKTIAKRRPGYAEYMERTSAFVPLPPRR